MKQVQKIKTVAVEDQSYPSAPPNNQISWWIEKCQIQASFDLCVCVRVCMYKFKFVHNIF